MRQQLVQRRRRAGFCLIQRRGTGRQATAVSKTGNEIRHRRIQMEQTAFHQHHQGDGRDRLGHRIDPRRGITLPRHGSLQIAQTGRVKIHLLAVLRSGPNNLQSVGST